MKKLLVITLTCLTLASVATAQERVSTIDKLADNVWAFSTYQVLGNIPFSAHGLIINTEEGVALVDAGWVPAQMQEVLDWISDSLGKEIKFCVITHAHDDRLGGAEIVRATGAKIICTPEVALEAAKHQLYVPDPVLSADEMLIVGGVKIRTYFPGPGHSPDNLVVWLPDQKILFGGCLIKSCDAQTLGYTADANVNQWPNSLNKVLGLFGNEANYIIPGHQGWNCEDPIQHTQRLILKHVIGE